MTLKMNWKWLFFVCCILALEGRAQVLPEPMASWSEAMKEEQRVAGEVMINNLNQQIADGSSTIVVPMGQYRFNGLFSLGGGAPSHIILSDFEGVTIDFQGSTLWFENAQSGIVLAYLKNCILRNVILDWDPVPFVQGRITGLDLVNQTILVDLDSGYDQVLPELAEGGSWRGCVFEPQTRKIKRGTPGFMLNFDWSNTDSIGRYRVGFGGFYGVSLADANIELNDLIAIFPRIGHAIRMGFCDNVTLEDVSLYASPFIGFVQSYGFGQSTFRRCKIIRRPGTDRLIGGNADGFNSSNAQQGPIIENCEINYIGDDFVNVFTAYSRLIWQESGTSLVSSRIHISAADMITKGIPQKALFFDRATMTPLGSRMVTSVSEVPSWTIQENQCLADLGADGDPWYSGEAAKLRYGATIPVHRLTLDAPITFSSDTIVVFEDFVSSGAVIRNCRFEGSLARGIRMQSPNVVIENNDISNTHSSGLSLGGQPHYWGEGPYVFNARISGNSFSDVAIGKWPIETAGIHIRQGGDYESNHIQHDISVTGNTFSGSGTNLLIARGVDDLIVADNNFSNFMLSPLVPLESPLSPGQAGEGYGLVFDTCIGVSLSNNSYLGMGPYANGYIFEAQSGLQAFDAKGWWRMHEGVGSVLADASGNGLTGSFQGDAMWVVESNDSKVSLDGSGDWIMVPDSAQLDLSASLSLGAWFFNDSSGGNDYVGIEKQLAYRLLCVEGTDSRSYWRFDIRVPNAGSWKSVLSSVSTPNNEWHHILATYDGTVMRLYVDGVLSGSLSYAGGISISSGSMEIGRRDGVASFKGMIDDVFVSDTVLSADDALELMTPIEVIVDNQDSNSSSSGTWNPSSLVSGYYGADYCYAAVGPTATFSFAPQLPLAGTYEVLARWSSGLNRASNAPYAITSGGGTVTLLVDQTVNGGSWQSLGFFYLDPATVEISVSNQDVDGFVIADAIKVIRK